MELLGTVTKLAGMLHVVLGDDARLRTWKGQREAAAKRVASGDRDASVAKDGSHAVVDMGGAGHALVIRAHGGVVLGAFFPKAKCTKKQRTDAIQQIARPASMPVKVGTIAIKGRLGLGWAVDDRAESDADDWLAVSLPNGRYDVYTDATSVEGSFGSVDERAFVIPEGATLETVAPPRRAVGGNVIASTSIGTGRIEAVIATVEAAKAWKEAHADAGTAKVGFRGTTVNAGACMIDVDGKQAVFTSLMAANEIHVVTRGDGSFVIAPGYGVRYDVEVDVSGSFAADVSAEPKKPTKVGSLAITGELVVSWAHEVTLKAKHVEALRKTGKPQDIGYGVLLKIPAATYDVFYDKTKMAKPWGTLAARCFLVPRP